MRTTNTKEKILSFLQNALFSLRIKELMEHVSISAVMMHRHLKILLAEGKIENT